METVRKVDACLVPLVRRSVGDEVIQWGALPEGSELGRAGILARQNRKIKRYSASRPSRVSLSLSARMGPTNFCRTMPALSMKNFSGMPLTP